MRQIFKSLFSLCLVLVFLLISCGDPENQNSDDTASLSYRIDSLFRSAVENQEIPAAVAYITVNEKEIYHKAFGWKIMESEVPLATSDIFRLASMTKALTAISIMQLVEKGSLDLDDEVYRYIPEFENPNILIEVLPDSSFRSRPAESEITIRQLLTHTSGIGYGFQDDMYNALIIKNNISEGFEDDERTSYENIQRIAGIPLLFEPGEDYVYSLSMDVLGVVIEQVSGLRYDRYIQQNILDPLNMDDSYFILPEEERYRLVSVYQPAETGVGLERTTYPDTAYPVARHKQFFSGGADLCSTADDYSNILKMLLNGGIYEGTRILSESSVETMLAKQSAYAEGDSYQGFAAWITNEVGAKKGPRGLGSFGFGGFYDTQSWADPELNLTAVLLFQMYPNNEYSIHQKFEDLVYQTIGK
ncbi:MAG TPA: class A beta-lactamase-related serine hydrolase [Bacteroides sp.]|nr:class A beta-lactamase-related serine hydrolase [Bacteroides sp.]